MAEALLRGPEIFMFALRVKSLENLLEEPDENKDKIEKIAAGIKKSLESYFKDYDAATDQKIVRALLKIYADNNAASFYPDFYSTINKKYKGDFAKYADKLFQNSMFDNKEELAAFLDNPKLKVLKKDMGFIASSDIIAKYGEIGKMVDEGQKNLRTSSMNYPLTMHALLGLMRIFQRRQNSLPMRQKDWEKKTQLR